METFAFAGLSVLLLIWLAGTRHGRLATAVLGIGLSTLQERKGATLVIVAGVGGVVAVLVALLSMSQGLQRTIRDTGDDATAIVLGGSSNESGSLLTREQVELIAGKPGILRGPDGKAVMSAETLGFVRLNKRSSGAPGRVGLRGVGAQAASVRANTRIVAGRLFRPGMHELIVGVSAREVFAGLDIGRDLTINSQTWRIVGAFASGDAHESEVFADSETLAAAFRRSGYQSVVVRLASPQSFEELKTALTADRQLKVNVRTTRDYYIAGSGSRIKVIHIVGNMIAAIMAVGALFGALNVTYTTVQSRAREIGTLRALGYDPLPILVAVMLETMLLAVLGGALGALLSWGLFDEFTASTLGASAGALAFRFDVSGALIWTGLKWALVIGFIGGMLPALQATTLSPATVLRQT